MVLSYWNPQKSFHFIVNQQSDSKINTDISWPGRGINITQLMLLTSYYKYILSSLSCFPCACNQAFDNNDICISKWAGKMEKREVNIRIFLFGIIFK